MYLDELKHKTNLLFNSDRYKVIEEGNILKVRIYSSRLRSYFQHYTINFSDFGCCASACLGHVKISYYIANRNRDARNLYFYKNILESIDIFKIRYERQMELMNEYEKMISSINNMSDDTLIEDIRDYKISKLI